MNETPKPPCGSFEAHQFASSPFLVGLVQFIRREEGNNAALLESKPPALSCLSPGVSARLQPFTRPSSEYKSCLENTDSRQKQRRQTRKDGSILVAPAPVSDSEDKAVVTINEIDGGGTIARIDWSRVIIRSPESADALAEGVRLAVSCHAALSRHRLLDISTASPTSGLTTAGMPQDSGQQQRMWPKQYHQQHLAYANVGDLVERKALPFASALPSVMKGIVEGSAEDAFVCLCVCLTFLEKTLCSISRGEAPPPRPQGKTSEVLEQSGLGKIAPGVGTDVDSGGGGGEGAGPAMILRDLIATPQVNFCGHACVFFCVTRYVCPRTVHTRK